MEPEVNEIIHLKKLKNLPAEYRYFIGKKIKCLFSTHNCNHGISGCLPGYYSAHSSLFSTIIQISAHNEYLGLEFESVSTEQSTGKEVGQDLLE